MLSVLADIERALERRMDRWEVCITPGTAVPSLDRHKQPVKYMLAYFGIGVDGKVRRLSMRRGRGATINTHTPGKQTGNQAVVGGVRQGD
jgi:hypothetical protein